jgi:sugar phosphate permease
MISESSATITDEKPTRSRIALYPWIIVALGAVFYCYEYFLRISPSVMYPSLVRAYHLQAASFGNLSAFYYYAYTPMQFFVGVLMDRYGPRQLLTFAAFACALGAYLFATSHILVVAEIGRFLIGFGSAFAFVGALKLATIWLPPERFGFVSGSILMLGMLGAMAGDISLTVLVQSEGWRMTTFISAGIGIVLVVSIWLTIRDENPDNREQRAAKSTATFKLLFAGLFKAIRNPQMWIIGAIGCFTYLPLSAFAELWGVPFLEQAHHISPDKASIVNGMVFLGWAVGGPLVGFLSDFIQRRRLPILIGSILSAVFIAIVLFVPGLSPVLIGTLFFFFGLFNSVQVLSFALAHEVNDHRIAGTVIALTNMFVMIGGVFFQPLIGMLLDDAWSGHMAHGAKVFTNGNYQMALVILPISLLLSAVLAFFLKETYCKHTSDCKIDEEHDACSKVNSITH